MEKPEYTIILYYNYVEIEDPEKLKQEQKDLCKKYNLKSRIIVAEEGINGTLEGKTEDVEKYIEEFTSDERFADTHIKKSAGDGKSFPRISVKVRPELVTLSLDPEKDINPNETTGKHITAEELHDWLTSGKEFYIVDMRNDYEHKVGYFEDSILAPLENFRDLPEKLEELEHLKDKPVVTVCTGGIRCEKASGLLVKNGFNEVYQLYGGIQTYMEKYPNQHFKGKLYVFDGRVTWAMNPDSQEHEIVSECEKCGETSDNYVDCAFLHCNDRRHFICCENCLDKNGLAFCNDKCKENAYSDEKFFIKYNQPEELKAEITSHDSEERNE
jgi:UPF0176 protein